MYLGESTGPTVALLLEGMIAGEKTYFAVVWSIFQGGDPLKVLFFVSNRNPDRDYFLLVFCLGESGVLEPMVVDLGRRNVFHLLLHLFRCRSAHENKLNITYNS